MKIIGNAKRFEETIENLANKTFLNELVLKKINIFLMFEYQHKFSLHLKKFLELKKLEIDYPKFHLTQNFMDAILSLENLKYLELKIENFRIEIVKSNLNALKKVSLFYMIF